MPISGGTVQVNQELGDAGIEVVPVPLGSGTSDRTAFETWLAGTAAGSTILHPPGMTWLQDSMVRYLPERLYVWPGIDTPSSRWKVIDSTAMGAASGMWVPQVWDSNSNVGQNPVQFEHPCLDGNKTTTTGSHHGLVMGGSHWYKIIRPEIFDVRGDCIRLTNLAKNGTTVLGGDAADGNITDVRLVGPRGCGIRQVLDASTNAHMDVQLDGGRIFDVGESAVLGDRMNGWRVSNLHLFVVRHYAIRSIDGWFDLGIFNNQIEDWGTANLVTDPYYNGTGTVSYAGIAAKGYDGQGCDISHNRVRITPTTAAEPGTAGTTSAYIWVEGAGVDNAGITVAYNLVHGPNAGLSRSGMSGVRYHASFNTLFVSGKGTNLVRNVNAASSTVGTVTSTGAMFV